MPRKFAKKGLKKPKSKSAPRRKLVGPWGAAALATAAVGKTVWDRRTKAYKASQRKAKRVFDNRVAQTDNIAVAAPVVVGKQSPRSFAEKVSAVDRPPLVFKRNYQFSAECASGRKGWFSMNVNQMMSDDLLTDITSYKSTQYTDGISTDSTVSGNALTDNARFYIDSHKEFIRMVNSSSNSITGKITLWCHKRDTDGAYDGFLINPINAMMYYSTNSRSLTTNGLGGEQVVGNGFTFNTTAGAVTNYNGVFNMPGSSLNATGVTASTDPSLSPSSRQIKDRVGFWFRQVGKSIPFSLKPGQQINSSYFFNLDKNKIMREQQEFTHIAGISYNIVVEFEGGIVGDSAVNNSISTGIAQLSVIRENQRVLGIESKYRSKIVLQTAPLTEIATANQVIINSDTGVGLSGAIVDA